MQKFRKENIKNVKIEGDKVKINFQKEVYIDIRRLRTTWKILKERELALILEKEKIQEIAKQAKIKLE